MDPFFSGVERARLAAADLVAAANHVVHRYTIRPEDVEDDVDATLLSQRWVRSDASRALATARDDLEFASRALTEVEAIAASVTAPRQGADEDRARAATIGRLETLADACERRAASLRS